MSTHTVAPGSASLMFRAQAEFPWLIYQACLASGTVSNTAYIRNAVAEALARDLGIPLEEITKNFPPLRTRSATLFVHGNGPVRYGQGNTVEEVR